MIQIVEFDVKHPLQQFLVGLDENRPRKYPIVSLDVNPPFRRLYVGFDEIAPDHALEIPGRALEPQAVVTTTTFLLGRKGPLSIS